ncbi:MAG: TraB/GumN family protein [Chitinophagaceae bacterium]|nr:MAG: TraB/GumN family protein [Chitinophagaceae bacterium]
MQLYPVALSPYSTMLLKRILPLYLLVFALLSNVNAQQNNKYQGLLWEITGNGLKKPSYLFGTMHVSSKLAFHLSDSFYHALKSVDAVALELNPDLWQAQMVRLVKLNDNFSAFSQSSGNDYVTENSFKITHYEDNLKAALSTEPPVVNSLLYRSYKVKEDFEEDTFLDLYIFQAGRKLGKAPAGVEDYFESEKLVMEAYRDMANEKKKKDIDLDGESMSSLLQKLQNAYRNGDLDLMDSLDNKMEKSVAFREKFLYKRNDIQADAIDSIIKKSSLFVGVGAAHLPGPRGVIDQLRKKGYTLRAVKMADRDGAQKEAINEMKVAVHFSSQKADDGAYTVDVPGPLYALQSNYQQLNRTQYADMSNGSYYMVTRVKTYASFIHQSPTDVAKKTDSLLYEYIPGDIISKKAISRNGYNGLDIVNRTRRGDIQRYHIFYTPFEVLIFKMSGKNSYVEGDEGKRFFSSIQLKEYSPSPLNFKASAAGFEINLPHEPQVYNNKAEEERWEYEAIDKNTGDAYLLMKKAIYNYDFLESDSFDLALMETSFRSADIFDKQLSRQPTTFNGYPALLVKEKLKSGDFIHAMFLIKGPQYYVLAQRSKSSADKAFTLYRSFRFTPVTYPNTATYVDTFLKISVRTPAAPEMDAGIRTIIEQTMEDAANGNNTGGYITYWKKARNGLFRDEKTGDLVSLQVQEYPKYFYIKDSTKFWKTEIDEHLGREDMVLQSQQMLTLNDGTTRACQIVIRDTASSRLINKLIVLKGRYLFTLSSMADSISKKNALSAGIFSSFQPTAAVLAENMYQSRLPLFFQDLFSKDSATQKRAQQSISNIYFGQDGSQMLYDAIGRLTINDKDYFDSKTRLIAELGYIKDTVSNDIPVYLKKIYEQTADTSMFQNEAIVALARLKTAASFKMLKELMLQDPPIFENTGDYSSFFGHFYDSLELSETLFPELLQLSTLNDYKANITGLLVTLVDSGYVKAKDYETYFPGIYIDAKVALRKQQAKEDKQLQEELKKKEQEEEDAERTYTSRVDDYSLNDYAVLLMPFYESNRNVQQFFTKLLLSKDDNVRMNTAVLFLRNGKLVPDSILQKLAADDKQRGLLYNMLDRVGRLDKFPKAYANQVALSRSFVVMQNEYDKMDSIVFLKKVTSNIKNKSGQVYFFKYRIKKTDDWKIAFSGLQPMNEKEISSDDELTLLTDKKIAKDQPLDEQLQKELKKVVFSFYNSGKNFYGSDDYSNYKYSGD